MSERVQYGEQLDNNTEMCYCFGIFKGVVKVTKEIDEALLDIRLAISKIGNACIEKDSAIEPYKAYQLGKFTRAVEFAMVELQ